MWLQNSDGGFATYELTRSYRWLEVDSPLSFTFLHFILVDSAQVHDLVIWLPSNDLLCLVSVRISVVHLKRTSLLHMSNSVWWLHIIKALTWDILRFLFKGIFILLLFINSRWWKPLEQWKMYKKILPSRCRSSSHNLFYGKIIISSLVNFTSNLEKLTIACDDSYNDLKLMPFFWPKFRICRNNLCFSPLPPEICGT